MHEEVAASGILTKMIPTGSVAVVSMMGIPLQDWTYIVAIAVGAVQILYTLYCWYRKWKDTPSKDSEED